MDALVEAHDEEEVQPGSLGAGQSIIGVNNRDLTYLSGGCDKQHPAAGAWLRRTPFIVSESGIKTSTRH